MNSGVNVDERSYTRRSQEVHRTKSSRTQALNPNSTKPLVDRVPPVLRRCEPNSRSLLNYGQ